MMVMDPMHIVYVFSGLAIGTGGYILGDSVIDHYFPNFKQRIRDYVSRK